MMAPELPSAGPQLTRRGRRTADRPTGPRWEVPRASAPGRQRYVLTLLLTGSGEHPVLDAGLFRRLRGMLRDRVRTTRNLTEIDVWLQSPGGDVHAAYKIALLLRCYGWSCPTTPRAPPPCSRWPPTRSTWPRRRSSVRSTRRWTAVAAGGGPR